MNYSPLGIDYQMAVINLIEPINPALITAFLIYKDTVQGRKPFPSGPYLYGLFDGLVNLLEVPSHEHELTVVLPRYPENQTKCCAAWDAGLEEAQQVYEHLVKKTTCEMIHHLDPIPEGKECHA